MYKTLVESIVSDRIVVAGDEVTLNCSHPDCPNPTNHLYFNIKKGIGFCHRCQSVTTIQGLIRHYTGVSWKEADNIVKGRGVHKAKNLMDRLNSIISLPDVDQEVTQISLPEGFISFSSDLYEFPYLEKRGIPYEMASELGMGFCDYGRWKDRLIIPVYEDFELKGFVGRSIYDPPKELSKAGEKVWARFNSYKKILNPKGFSSSRLIYNYDNIEDKIIITEGIFDAISVFPYGVALFGKHMSTYQQSKILLKKPKQIYVMLDSDAKADALAIAESLSMSGIDTFMVSLPDGDPGSTCVEKISFYLRRAKKVSPMKLFSINS